jgi:hypothetical protein
MAILSARFIRIPRRLDWSSAAEQKRGGTVTSRLSPDFTDSGWVGDRSMESGAPLDLRDLPPSLLLRADEGTR